MCDIAGKFEEWRDQLCGGDVHSVQQQIFRMMWNAAVFNLVRKARELALHDGEGEVQHNWAVSEFILTGYFETQSLGIRRLLDPRRDVVSLKRLVTDLEKAVHLLTRRNILAAAECPYDYEEVIEGPDHHGVSGPELAKTAFSEEMHARIDSLTGVEATARSPDDKVRPEVIKRLKCRLNQCDEIYTYVTKFFAHAATQDSRDKKNADEIKLTLRKISEVHRILCENTAFIAKSILGLPFDQFLVLYTRDVFENLTAPMASEETVPQLREEWESYERTTREWANWTSCDEVAK